MEDVLRSLITLKALTYAPTGAIVAALTTSLPEEIGGERNWDYRFCWLRDGSFTLAPLVQSGYMDEAVAWLDWLLRAIAGDSSQLQLMYGIGAEHRLTELELPWLSGYEGSKPVRIGNAASEQFQLDIFGEVLAVIYHAFELGSPRDRTRSPGIELGDAIEHVERMWREPDEGIWEIRGNSSTSPTPRSPPGPRSIARSSTSRRQGRMRPSTAGEPLATDPCRGPGQRLRRRAQHVRPVLRRERPGCEPAAHPDLRLSAGGRPARPGHDRRDPAGDLRGAVRLALLDGGRRGRACRR